VLFLLRHVCGTSAEELHADGVAGVHERLQDRRVLRRRLDVALVPAVYTGDGCRQPALLLFTRPPYRRAP